MATIPPPYVELMSPDWAARAALAIAADLCDRHGIQDEMRRLDQPMRHEMLAFHAGVIRNEWREEFRNTIPASCSHDSGRHMPGLMELIAEPAVPAQLLRALDLVSLLLMMIEDSAKGDEFRNQGETLAYIRGLAGGGQRALRTLREPFETALPDLASDEERRPE